MIARPAPRPPAPAKLVRTAAARVPAPPPFKHLLAMSLAAPQVKGPAPLVPRGHVDPTHVAISPKAHAVAPARHEHEHEHDRDRDREKAPVDPLDPAVRTSAALAPPAHLPASSAAEPVAARTRVSLEDLLPLVVRRIAWGGDRTKGAVHVELSGGAFAGTTVTVHAEGRRVRLELGGAGDHDALRERLESRLRRAGIEVEGVR